MLNILAFLIQDLALLVTLFEHLGVTQLKREKSEKGGVVQAQPT